MPSRRTRPEAAPARTAPDTTRPWPERSFDVIVGNPPWTEPQPRPGGDLPDKWAAQRELPVGNRSRSQLFLWRALSLLQDGGPCALLVAALAFLTARSKDFRSRWLGQVRLERVVNFTSARDVFFTSSIAPFMLIQCTASGEPPPARHRFVYETVVPSHALGGAKSMAVGQLERRVLAQASLQA